MLTTTVRSSERGAVQSHTSFTPYQDGFAATMYQIQPMPETAPNHNHVWI